ncbi:MFS transporter [Actinomadura rupiterrae]|uniref:MFS transporter n=1 Tax=Actinomadura rupiterrae TaxID=559627 RepID=UPI0020A336CD|nr:MFS transporter [Actinomadura rupiterrae]MCP2340014.1 EmrB/QacA subfamily drug resistance transporter [Actinomadura rupiterrae]
MDGRRVFALGSVIVAQVMAVVDYNVVSVAIPRLLRDFRGSSLAGLSWTITGYTVVFAAVLLPAGGLADRYGPRRIYLSGLAVFTAGSLACALASGPGTLVGARLLQAAGGGMVVALGMSIGVDAFPGRRSQAFALFGAVSGVAAAAGPALGSALIALGGWRWIFLINLPLGLLALGCGAFGVRAVRREDGAVRGLPDLLGAALLAVGVAGIVLGLVRGPDWGWTSGRVLGSALAGVATTALGVVASLRHPRPAADFTLLRARTTALGNGGMVLAAVVSFAVPLAAALFLTARWNYSTLGVGLALTPAPLTSAVSSWLSGPLVRRLGTRAVLVAGGVAGAAGWSWPAVTGSDGPYALVLLPALIVGTAGTAVLTIALQTLAMAAVPTGRSGNGSALIMLARSAGAAIGIGGLTALLHGASGDGFRAVWAGMALSLVLIAAIGGTYAGRPPPGGSGGRRDATQGGGHAADSVP